MDKFYKNIINDKDKELKWFNTNYCYAFTIIFSIVLLVCYFGFHDKLNAICINNHFWNVYLMSFDHFSVVHITFNVIMFILLSLLLERHFGSFTYFVMIMCIIPIANITCFATESLLYPNSIAGWSGSGESCVNSFLIGMYIVITLIYFKQYILSKRAFLTFIPMALNVFFFSVDSNAISTPKQFFAHPQMKFMHAFYDNVAGHFAPFVMGIVVTILIFAIVLTNKFLHKNLINKMIDKDNKKQ